MPLPCFVGLVVLQSLSDTAADDRLRMREQCALWAKWLGEQPALPGRPCNFVNTSRPDEVFSVPRGAKDHAVFQPWSDVKKNWQRFQADSMLPGGTGPIPSLRQYLRLLRASRLVRGASVHVVQVGANVGGSEFNEWVHPLLQANPTWTATVIEPTSWAFEKLLKNYAGTGERRWPPMLDRVQPMAVAIATFTGPCPMQHNLANPQ